MQNIRKHSPIVQSVERRTVNPYVVGSSPTRGATWPVGQAVKTPPFHGGIRGSIPLPVTNGRLAQLGERLPYKQNVGGSIPSATTIFHVTSYCLARWFSWLECRPVTAEVEGSSPFRVAKPASVAQLVEQGTENPCVHSSILC